MSDINFPTNVVDGTTFFHGDNVCVFHEDTQTWECTAVSSTTAQPPTQNIYITTDKVHTLGDKRTEWQTKLTDNGVVFTVPTVYSQEEVNNMIIDLLIYLKDNNLGGVSQAYVDAELASINASIAATNATVAGINTDLPSDVPTRAEFNALVTTVMAAVANGID